MDILSSSLYPPVVTTYQPVFVLGENPRIYFLLSDFNNISSIEGVQLAISDQKTGQSLLNKQRYPNNYVTLPYSYDEEKGEYWVELSENILQNPFVNNKYYKIQLRFVENTIMEVYSQWSQACLVKAISRPTIKSTTFGDSNQYKTLLFYHMAGLTYLQAWCLRKTMKLKLYTNIRLYYMNK